MNPSQILSLTKEAAVLVEKNRLSYANPAAVEILGSDCVGKSLLSLFGSDIAGTQASSFIADVPVNGKACILRVSKLENAQIVFISPADTAPVLFNDAILFSANTVLNNISISAAQGRTLAESLASEEMLSVFCALTRSSHSLTRLMNNVNIVRSMAEGNLRTELHMTDLSMLYGSFIDTIRRLHPKDIFSIDLGEHITVPLDYQLAKQLLFNLISNCLIHAEGCTKVSINLSETTDSVLLSISDNGCGIPADQLHSVFDRYKHGFGMQQLSKGAGLGLAVVRAAAELHGGTLLIESRPNQGTCVRVSLSKDIRGVLCLKAPLEDYCGQMHSILTGLADCLPQECFSEKYTD